MARPKTVAAVRAIVLVMVVGAILAGCGRRGRLEPPPTPESEKAAADKAATSKSGVRKRAPNPPIRAPETPFILDPLLQ